MYCGSCMRDNTLVSALQRLGHEALLIPTYTPISTDEPDVSQPQVFFGGINVYLEQKFWLFRHTPKFLDRLLNSRRLLRWASRFAARTRYSELGELTVSMLQGLSGRQRKEVKRLVTWLREVAQPQIVVLTNALLSGILPALRNDLGVPTFVTLQGDDIFLDALPDMDRQRCFELIRLNCEGAHFICTSRYYADFMSVYLGLPRDRMHVVYPGLNLAGHGRNEPHESGSDWRPTIGYFARICPEKGFHNLVDAFIRLRAQAGAPRAKLKASGWLGENHKPFFAAQLQALRDAHLAADFEYVPCPTHTEKVRFLQSLDVLSVPTEYREPKGLYVLEAWANGVPVVLPRHGSFVELVESTGGGLLVTSGDPDDLALGLRRMLEDHELRRQCGRAGESAVRERFTAEVMARETLAVLSRYVGDTPVNHAPPAID
jgi:glycosyltransferase involved in cell wall biosynthesis